MCDICFLNVAYVPARYDKIAETVLFEKLWIRGGAAAVLQRWPMDPLPGWKRGWKPQTLKCKPNQHFRPLDGTDGQLDARSACVAVSQGINHAKAMYRGDAHSDYDGSDGYFAWRKSLRDYASSGKLQHLLQARATMKRYPRLFTPRWTAEQAALLGFDLDFTVWLIWDRFGLPANTLPVLTGVKIVWPHWSQIGQPKQLTWPHGNPPQDSAQHEPPCQARKGRSASRRQLAGRASTSK